jgi:hypothetical protein
LGVDLASEPKKTAACLVHWQAEVVIETPVTGLSDANLLDLMAQADKVGVDVPFGWPLEFVRSVAAFTAGSPWVTMHTDSSLTLRATDRFVWSEIGRRPLSVSTDKIGVPAMRAARLLGLVDGNLDRSGGGRLVEVYPAASLTVWGFNANRYKGRIGADTRMRLVEAFRLATNNWVVLSDECYAACVADDNAFDALIGALTARAASIGLCKAVPADAIDAARSEGWIALPVRGSLVRLADKS